MDEAIAPVLDILREAASSANASTLQAGRGDRKKIASVFGGRLGDCRGRHLWLDLEATRNR